MVRVKSLWRKEMLKNYDSVDTTALINESARKEDPKTTFRKKLEEQYGEVYDTDEAQDKFEFVGFGAPFVVVVRRSDGVKGSLEFSHNPRFYFDFKRS
jgi:hypothetical protein